MLYTVKFYINKALTEAEKASVRAACSEAVRGGFNDYEEARKMGLLIMDVLNLSVPDSIRDIEVKEASLPPPVVIPEMTEEQRLFFQFLDGGAFATKWRSMGEQ